MGSNSGAFVVVAVFLLMIAWIFVAPAIVAHAWALFAVGMFGAPAISYWTSFWVTWAIHILFNFRVNTSHKGS